MRNLIKNELFKIFKSKRIYIFIAILVILALIPCVGNLIFNKGNYGPEASGQMLPYSLLTMYLEIILPMFITVLISDMYTEEYSGGTLKLQMIHPISRGKLLFSKVIALAIAILTLLIFAMLAGYLLGTVFFGWGEIFHVNEVSYSSGNAILLTLGSYILSLIPLLSFGMVILLICMQFNSGGAAVGTSIGVFLILTYINLLIEAAKPYMITHYFDIHTLLIKTFDLTTTLTYFGVLAIYGVISYMISHLLFRNKDILY